MDNFTIRVEQEHWLKRFWKKGPAHQTGKLILYGTVMSGEPKVGDTISLTAEITGIEQFCDGKGNGPGRKPGLLLGNIQQDWFNRASNEETS